MNRKYTFPQLLRNIWIVRFFNPLLVFWIHSFQLIQSFIQSLIFILNMTFWHYKASCLLITYDFKWLLWHILGWYFQFLIFISAYCLHTIVDFALVYLYMRAHFDLIIFLHFPPPFSFLLFFLYFCVISF